MHKIKSFLIQNKLELVLLTLILLIGAFCRFYKIDQYMTFLGDEGRDVIIVRRLLIEHHPPLIGPGTSIGNMYLGPAYYYMMAIPLLITNFNPVGPAIFIALMGLITILFVWYVSREWFPINNKVNYGALVAAFLYAVSPVIIIYSRSSWNPNIMPFFSLLTIYGIWRVWQKKDLKWLIIVGISFAFCMQSHYLALLLLPVILIIWVFTYLKINKKRRFIIYSIISLVLFLVLMSPLAIFDFRHNFINFKAMKVFFTDRQTTVSVLPWKALPQISQIFVQIITDIVGAKNMPTGIFVSLLTAISFVYVFFVNREKYDEKKVSVKLITTLWIVFALIGLGLYKQHIYDHYFGFIFTAPFIAFGGIINKVYRMKYAVFSILATFFIVGICFVDLQNSPLRSAPNRQLERAQVVSRKVEEIANGQKFNFALIADSNYDSGYRYFLDIDHAKVIDIDLGNTKGTITDHLIVVCERVKEKCDPTHNAKTEISHWGWSKVETEYDDVFGVTVYKLGHVNQK